MRIALLSDLHLPVQPMDAPQLEADVVVLAGDLGRPKAAIEWACRYAQPTLFVSGNHEHHGSDLVSAAAELRALAAGTQVHFLERGEWRHGNVRFLGCTVWSDHALQATEQARAEAHRHALAMVRDFSRIRIASASGW